jgi:hypothetical protein
MCRVNTYFHELHLGWYFVVADYVEITKKKKKRFTAEHAVNHMTHRMKNFSKWFHPYITVTAVSHK